MSYRQRIAETMPEFCNHADPGASQQNTPENPHISKQPCMAYAVSGGWYKFLSHCLVCSTLHPQCCAYTTLIAINRDKQSCFSWF